MIAPALQPRAGLHGFRLAAAASTLIALLNAPPVGAQTAPAPETVPGDQPVLTLNVGEKKTFPLERPARRISLSNRGIITIFMPEPQTVIATGTASGFTEMLIEYTDGSLQRAGWRVVGATPQFIETLAEELEKYLDPVGRVRVATANDKILLTGEVEKEFQPYYDQIVSMFQDVVVSLVTFTDKSKEALLQEEKEQEQLQTITITTPGPKSVLSVGSPVDIVTDARTEQGVQKVNFYLGDTLIGSSSTGQPFAFSWKPAAAGTYQLSAEAVTTTGRLVRSSPVTVTVTRPSVTLTAPAADAQIPIGPPIRVSARAESSAGVAQVQFFVELLQPEGTSGASTATIPDGSSPIGSQDTTSPNPASTQPSGRTSLGIDTVEQDGWNATWNPTTPGLYQLQAVMTDARGETFASGTVNVRISGQIIQVDAEVVEIDRDAASSLGVQWFTGQSGTWQILGNAGVSSNNLSTLFSTTPTSSGSLALTTQWDFKALIDKGLAKFLAAPKLTVQSGSSASFLVGGEIPIVSVTANSSNVDYKPFGTQLTISPVVKSDDEIFINLTAIVSTIDDSINVQGNPGLKKKQATTNLTVKSGQPFAVAGLFSTEETVNDSKVPLLGDIPGLGYLFKSTQKTTRNLETVVVMTPKIVPPGETNQSSLSPDIQKLMQQEVARRQALQAEREKLQQQNPARSPTPASPPPRSPTPARPSP
ncbi:MAG: Ig-like domain-containing protein, partial [Verrucomicrobiia bacterium]